MANPIKKMLSRKFDNNLHQRIRMGMKYTPDAGYLEQFHDQKLFVTDNWMAGYLEENPIGAEKLLYPTAFTQDLFEMVYKPLGDCSYPIALETKQDIDKKPGWVGPNPVAELTRRAKIRGQLWSVRSPLFRNLLDVIRENGIVFLRKRVTIEVPLRMVQNGKDMYRVSSSDSEVLIKRYKGLVNYMVIPSGGAKLYTHLMRAWMYVGVPSYWAGLQYDQDKDKRGYELPQVKVIRPHNPIIKDYFYWLRNGDNNK